MTDEEALATVQGTPEWFAARCGYAGASDFAATMAKGEGKTRAAYLLEVVAERLTGKPTLNGFTNAHMRRGTAQEPFARMAYEAATGNPVQEVGFIRHTLIHKTEPRWMVGCSPDGLIDDDGGLEIKCVIPTVQLNTIKRGGCPGEHLGQIQGSLWLTKRTWWDFCSYSPDLPGKLGTYIFRVQRAPAYITRLAAEIKVYLDEVDAMVAHLRERQ